jgi:hypothetical protein
MFSWLSWLRWMTPIANSLEDRPVAEKISCPKHGGKSMFVAQNTVRMCLLCLAEIASEHGIESMDEWGEKVPIPKISQ